MKTALLFVLCAVAGLTLASMAPATLARASDRDTTLADAVGEQHADLVAPDLAAAPAASIPDAGFSRFRGFDAGVPAAVKVPDPNDTAGFMTWWVNGVSKGKFSFWAGASFLLMAGLWLARRLLPGPFSTDEGGTAFAFATAVLGGVGTTWAAGSTVGLVTFLAALKVGVGATGGYSVLWKKLARPLMVRAGILAV